MQQNDFFTAGVKVEGEEIDIKRISVLVPLPVDTVYTYFIPSDSHVAIGSYVRVPVAARLLTGVVWDEAADMAVPLKKLKPIQDICALDPLAETHRRFIDRMARYTMAPRGSILKMTLNTPAALEEPKTTTSYKWTKMCVKTSTPKRKLVVEAVKQAGHAMRLQQLVKAAKVSAATIKAMVIDGELEQELVPEQPPCCFPLTARLGASAKDGITLSEDQKSAADALCAGIDKKHFKPYVLDGVTGSGKTEVYFEAVAAALKQNKQVLILLPEIALSNAFLDRFTQRFGCAPALWHSAVSPAQRRKTWRGVATAQTKVVIGARSALFLPFKNLGLIVVDEEHDPAFKQEEGVIYHARDMAVMRAFLQDCPIILVSATPSLETVQNIRDKRYEHLELPSRFGKAVLPQMHIVNMKEEKLPRSEFISQTVRAALLETYQRGEQSLLFLNRRGYAPLTLCRSCGHRYECPQCSSWLVLHGNIAGNAKAQGRLQCHHCGFSTVLTQKCTSCGAEDSLVPCGPGVERIEEEVCALFPQMRHMVLTSDTSGEGEDFFTALEKIRSGAVDLVIGTQIMAKGHHFPNLTCVGVIDADLGLKGGDLRAGEHTWQLLQQVAGRAGRGVLEGHVYIQTYAPDSNFMQALVSGDRDKFQVMELSDRRIADMPPFWRLSSLIVSSESEEELGNYVREMAKCAPAAAQDDVRYYGPAPAPLYMLRGRYRGRFLIQSRKSVDIQALIAEWLNAVKAPKSSKLRVQIDIDPHSFV